MPGIFTLQSGLCSNDQNHNGWRWNRQEIAWKPWCLSTSLSTLYFILELNWTVRNKMLWPHCLVLSTPPYSFLWENCSCQVTFRSPPLTCQQKILQETVSGKLQLHILQRHCSRHDIIHLSVSSIWHELENFYRGSIRKSGACSDLLLWTNMFFPSWTMRIIIYFLFNPGCQEIQDEIYDSLRATV